MIKSEDVAALILCAGRSSRMADLKPLLPLGEDNFIVRNVNLYRKAGIRDVLVVLGHESEIVKPFLEKTGAAWVINEHYDSGMFSSVQTGVRNLNKFRRAFFLHPADIPFVRPETLQILMHSFPEEGADVVCRPCCRGRRGHPPLVSISFAGRIGEFKGEGGMRAFLACCGGKMLDVECNDDGILADIDTPEEYAEALKKFSL